MSSFSNKGFALVYNIDLFKEKIIKGKIPDRSLFIFQKNLKKDTFTEKNLWKIFYLEGKDYLNDLINFKLFLLEIKNWKIAKNKDSQSAKFPKEGAIS